MTVQISGKKEKTVIFQVEVKLEDNMMEMEDSILKAVHEARAYATREALTRFDKNGDKIPVEEVKLARKDEVKKVIG